MTKRVKDNLVIEKETSQQCDDCGKIAELRPYGKGGACVCFDCAMEDADEAEKQFEMRLRGEHRIDS